jgi:hypothetical protein
METSLDCVGSDADLFMSPGLEKAALGSLNSPERRQRVESAQILEYSISVEAKQVLVDLWRSARNAPPSSETLAEANSYLRVLFRSRGWVLTPGEIDALDASCSDERCHRQVVDYRRSLQGPIEISGGSAVLVGPYGIPSFLDLKAKIGQFPKSTEFRIFDSENIWPVEQQSEPLLQILSNAGMRIVP